LIHRVASIPVLPIYRQLELIPAATWQGVFCEFSKTFALTLQSAKAMLATSLSMPV